LGPEFPSLLGALIGLAVVVFAASKGFLIPKDTWKFPAQKEWSDEWTGNEKAGSGTTESVISLVRAWIPYILVALGLVVTRIDFFPFGDWLNYWVFEWGNIMGTSLSFMQAPLDLPGLFPFIPIALFAIPIFGMSKEKVNNAMKNTFKQLIPVLIALVFAVAMVQVMVQSAHNNSENASMIMVMAKYTSNL